MGDDSAEQDNKQAASLFTAGLYMVIIGLCCNLLSVYISIWVMVKKYERNGQI